jgi:hypothetical protein
VARARAALAGLRRAPDRVAGTAALVATTAVLATLVIGWTRRRDPWLDEKR